MTTGEGGHESDRPLCISGGCLCGGFGRRGRSWVAGGNGRRGRGRRACAAAAEDRLRPRRRGRFRSEEHTSELQSLMRISYAVFCLKKKNTQEEDEERQK